MKRSILTVLLVSASLLAGCKDDTASKDTTTATPPVPGNSAPAKDTATPVPAAPVPATPAPVQPQANTAAADASAAAQTKAQQLFDQGMSYVKENKLDLAEGALNQLDGMKAQLPADWTPRIDQLRSAINTAKAASGKVPGNLLPGGK